MARVDRVVATRNRYRAAPGGVAGVIDGPVTRPADHRRLNVSRQIDRLLAAERSDDIISALQVDDVVTLADKDSETIAIPGLDQIVAVAGNDRSGAAGGVDGIVSLIADQNFLGGAAEDRSGLVSGQYDALSTRVEVVNGVAVAMTTRTGRVRHIVNV